MSITLLQPSVLCGAGIMISIFQMLCYRIRGFISSCLRRRNGAASTIKSCGLMDGVDTARHEKLLRNHIAAAVAWRGGYGRRIPYLLSLFNIRSRRVSCIVSGVVVFSRIFLMSCMSPILFTYRGMRSFFCVLNEQVERWMNDCIQPFPSFCSVSFPKLEIPT